MVRGALIRHPAGRVCYAEGLVHALSAVISAPVAMAVAGELVLKRGAAWTSRRAPHGEAITAGEGIGPALQQFAVFLRADDLRYREMMVHVVREIGAQPLAKVSTLKLQRVYNKMLKEVKKDGTPLSIKTVRNTHGMVHVAFETAVSWGLLRSNPASRCKLPPAAKREAVSLGFREVYRLLESSSEHWLAALLIVGVGSGARRGELLALTWRQVDIEAGTITISASLEQIKSVVRVKSTKGRNIRTVTLPPDALDAMKSLKDLQCGNRDLCGAAYRADLDLVFCHPDGNYILPGTVTKAVRRIAKKAGFTGVSLHTLRHSHGSQLLGAGVPLPTVSKRLGHTNVYVTATVYSHALATDEAAAAEKREIARKDSTSSNVVTMPGKKSA